MLEMLYACSKKGRSKDTLMFDGQCVNQLLAMKINVETY